MTLTPFDASGNGESGPPNDSVGVGLLVWLSELARGPAEVEPQDGGDGFGAARVIGPFRLEGLLGQGAYGAVFRAFDNELERPVALKVAWPHVMFDKTSARRFVEEPKTAAALDHPGIVKIYRSGWVDAVCYIAFELIDGPSLREWLKSQEHVPFNLAAEIIATVADAVQYAHERGVIHRDLKPGNILLTPRPGFEYFPYRPMVGDFGLAARARPAALSALTGTHDVIGTDPYVAPEQLDGSKGKTEPASDVFSLGVMLYEVVAGRRPFGGENAEQTRHLIRHEEPPSVRSFRPSVPLDLSTIVGKCLQKSTAARYKSAGDLAGDLRRFINHEPIHARRVALWQRAWKYTRRKPLVVSLVSLAAVSVIVVASLLGALVANRISASRRIEAAEAATDVAQRMERQRQYAANIRHAAESLRRVGPREAVKLLDECRSLADESSAPGIEWDLLDSQIGNADRIIEAHRGRIYVLNFSADGKYAVTAGQDTRVKLWDTADWSKWRQFDDGIEDTNVARFSADGTLLAVAGDDGRVLIHRLPDGQLVYDEPVIKGRVFDMAWLGDRHELAVGGDGPVVRVIDAKARRLRGEVNVADQRPYPGSALPAEEIEVLAYLPAGDAIAVTTSRAMDHLVDAASLKVMKSWVDVSHGAMCHVPLGPGYLISGGSRALAIWDIATNQCKAQVDLHQHPRSISYSAAGQCVAVFLRDGTAFTWSFDALLAGHAPARQFVSGGDRASSGDVSPDGRSVVVGDDAGRIHVWEGKLAASPFDVELDRRVRLARFSPDGKWLAVVAASFVEDTRLTVFEIGSRRAAWSAAAQVAPLNFYDNAFGRSPWPIDFDADNEEIIFGRPDKSLCGRNLRTGEQLRVYLAATEAEIAIRHVQVLPDATKLYVTRTPESAYIIDRSTLAVGDAPFEDDILRYGMVSTVLGDHWLVSDVKARAIRLRDAASGKQVATLPECPDLDNFRLAVSPDRRQLAIGGKGRIIYSWDLVAGGPPKKFIGHEGMIADLCFSPDGRTILSHGADGTVRFWHVTTGAELLKLGTPEEPITCMGLNPAGNLLVLGVERDGHYGLQLYRLGKDRNSLPKSFAGLPARQVPDP